jgi:hypothetical protein
VELTVKAIVDSHCDLTTGRRCYTAYLVPRPSARRIVLLETTDPRRARQAVTAILPLLDSFLEWQTPAFQVN